jgi:uncharacterized membrane protein (DUF373 family)
MREVRIWQLLAIGFALFALGASLNLYAIKNNGYKMPIKVKDFVFNTQCYKSFYNDSEVNASWLVDRINVGFAIISIGDIIAFIGFLLVFGVCCYVLYVWFKK